jgi:putative oligomerization/nucleic acid binding protein
MGFHIYTDGWWRNPKNAVTTEATIVEIRKTHRFGGDQYKNAGYYQSVVADVSDPETGQMVRTTNGEVYSGLQPFEVGQRITVRWSAKRKSFELYSWNTAPDVGTSGVQVVSTQNAAAAQPDPISQLERLAALRQSGALTDAEFEQQKRRILGQS